MRAADTPASPYLTGEIFNLDESVAGSPGGEIANSDRRYTVHMTIDERLERLTERHEALTQSVELLLLSHTKFEEGLTKLQQMQVKNEQMQAKNEQMQAKNEVLMGQVLESINALARIAAAHEHRISTIEGRST